MIDITTTRAAPSALPRRPFYDQSSKTRWPGWSMANGSPPRAAPLKAHSRRRCRQGPALAVQPHHAPTPEGTSSEARPLHAENSRHHCGQRRRAAGTGHAGAQSHSLGRGECWCPGCRPAHNWHTRPTHPGHVPATIRSAQGNRLAPQAAKGALARAPEESSRTGFGGGRNTARAAAMRRQGSCPVSTPPCGPRPPGASLPDAQATQAPSIQISQPPTTAKARSRSGPWQGWGASSDSGPKQGVPRSCLQKR